MSHDFQQLDGMTAGQCGLLSYYFNGKSLAASRDALIWPSRNLRRCRRPHDKRKPHQPQGENQPADLFGMPYENSQAMGRRPLPRQKLSP